MDYKKHVVPLLQGQKLENPLFTNGGLVVGYEKKRNKEKIYYIADDIHSVVLGATRSGKSRRCVLESIGILGLANENCFVVDPKSELYLYTYPFMEQLGYDVYALDFKTPSKSCHYNLLQPIIDAINDNDIPLAVDKTWDLTSALVDKPKGEKIWSNGEACIIASSILAVVIENKENKEYQNLTNVYHFISTMCVSDKDGNMPINKYMDSLDDTHPAKSLFRICKIAPEKTRGSFFTSALITLRLFMNENIYNITCKSDFKLTDFGEGKKIIYMILPDERDSFYPIASLFIYQLYVELVAISDARGGRLKNRFNFLGDEWGNFTKIDMFPSMLTVGGRSWNQIRTGLFYKVIRKFMINIGKEQGENIFDNNQTTLYLKTANQNTALEISRKLGNYTTSVHSLSNSQSESMKNLNTSTGNSENLTARPLLTSDEILRIKSPSALLMSAGKFSAIMNLPDLHKWYFNLLFKMGNEEHNRKLREEREKNRPKFKMQKMKLWDIDKSIIKDNKPNNDDSIDEYINNDLWDY